MNQSHSIDSLEREYVELTSEISRLHSARNKISERLLAMKSHHAVVCRNLAAAQGRLHELTRQIVALRSERQ